MSTQQELTRAGITIPGQRRAAAEEAAPTAPLAEVAPAGTPVEVDVQVHRTWDDEGWVTVVRVATSRALLAAVASLLVWSVLPLALGWTPQVILSGSMEPRISVGDVVVTRPVRPAQLVDGAVVTAQDPDKPGRTRTHRIVARTDDGLVVTKGDANRDRDSSPVTVDDVLGVGMIRVPWIGLPKYWLASGDLLPLGAGFAVLSGLVLAAWRPSRGDQGDRGDRGTTGGGATGGERGRHRASVAAVAMVAAGMAAAAPGTSAAFASTTTNLDSSFRAAAAFASYADAVLADSPIVFWRLDETRNGRVEDSSGNGQTATSDRVTFGRQGALSSDGRSTAAGFDNSAVTYDGDAQSFGGDYSAEIWVRTTSPDGGPLVAWRSEEPDGKADRALYLGNDGKVRFARGEARVVGPKINDGAWHHVVFTNQGSGPNDQRAKLYVDGRAVARGGPIEGETRGRLVLGRAKLTGPGWQGRPAENFRGDLDEAAFYLHALSESQVGDHYRASGR